TAAGGAPIPADPPMPAAADWRALAHGGDFDSAYAALKKATVRDDAKELFLASDVARLSGHPEEALAPLRQLASRHREDERAPLAIFTTGRILLEDLGRPREAAEEFA